MEWSLLILSDEALFNEWGILFLIGCSKKARLLWAIAWKRKWHSQMVGNICAGGARKFDKVIKRIICAEGAEIWKNLVWLLKKQHETMTPLFFVAWFYDPPYRRWFDFTTPPIRGDLILRPPPPDFSDPSTLIINDGPLIFLKMKNRKRV